jgi:adenylate cyclase
LERALRLSTGLVLFTFTTSHFLNHSFGIHSVDAMQAAAHVLLKPWQSAPGLALLYGSWIIHAALGFAALYRRRHLRMPASEAWQLALGLAIPLLLLFHAGSIRIGTSVYDLPYGFGRLLHTFWVVSPDNALIRQLALLTLVWVHGCIGIRAWLRTKRWYARAATPLASLATLLPALALAGVASAGLELRRDPALAARFAPAPAGSAAAEHAASVREAVDALVALYLVLLVGVLLRRLVRNWAVARGRGVRIAYPGGQAVVVPRGFTVLEASRWAGIPHASVCGGRGRCSTCRVRVLAGLPALGAPGAVERRTLARIGAPPEVRLACQVRPQADLAVEPLVRPSSGALESGARFDAVVEGGQELEITAVFIDLRDSTRIATGRLPYDVLFLFDRYIQVVTGAVRANGGHVTSIAGDGVMSVFGADGRAADAARAALQAVLQVWEGIERLERELGAELGAPLRFGIGMHAGVAVVGRISDAATSLQFLGDAGNVAAKLEANTKEHGCTVIVSADALRLAAPDRIALADTSISLPGRSQPLAAALFDDAEPLRRLVAALP